ncbi:VWA domain-containing protein [Saccharopolyspora sp. K220]|uniref:VWA domain-containing protein n=1 Tax=Saccharopolyspora soli TaxID=2926618 RepID=UPI001F5981F9|nr:VWA domain-containing protein [Saccharopolyspora soli]MCI2421141.1 VWA domain-containing protein [Saccharopolyspora soli]
MALTTKVADLARRAGAWLGCLTAPQAPRHTTAIEGDAMDTMAYTEVAEQSPTLRELSHELRQTVDGADDLLADVFRGAYKAHPRVRPSGDMDPARRVQHQVVAALLDTPEFGAMRTTTVGDQYLSAVAVLASASTIRDMLDKADAAQAAAKAAAAAQQAADAAAAGVESAFEQATEVADGEGAVPDVAAEAVQDAIAAVEAAEAAAQQAGQEAAQKLDDAAPRLQAAARAAAQEADDAVQEETALIRAWGIEPGQLERMDFAERAALAERLRTLPLSRFAEFIGRFKAMASAERARKVPRTPGEIIGTTLGNDLTRLIPSEIAHLTLPTLRAPFAARLATRQLMLYNSQGTQRAGQGAIIACIDCSGTMRIQHRGITREAWAKACALALLDQARAAGRDFVGILFSSHNQVETFLFPGGNNDLDTVLAFAEKFWGGGTDFTTPLRTAADLLQTEADIAHRQRGDIVLITDGIASVDASWQHQWVETKAALGFRAFAVAIGDDSAVQPGAVLTRLCDNVRAIDDLTDPRAVADLFRTI